MRCAWKSATLRLLRFIRSAFRGLLPASQTCWRTFKKARQLMEHRRLVFLLLEVQTVRLLITIILIMGAMKVELETFFALEFLSQLQCLEVNFASALRFGFLAPHWWAPSLSLASSSHCLLCFSGHFQMHLPCSRIYLLGLNSALQLNRKIPSPKLSLWNSLWFGFDFVLLSFWGLLQQSFSLIAASA